MLVVIKVSVTNLDCYSIARHRRFEVLKKLELFHDEDREKKDNIHFACYGYIVLILIC